VPYKDPEKYKAYQREYQREYCAVARSKNPELFRARDRQRYTRESDKRKEASRRYRIEYPEKVRLVKQRWKLKNPDRVRASHARRRAREAGASGVKYTTHDHIAARVTLFGGVCAYCREAPYEHLDHVIPLSRGGSHWPANLRPACSSCNMKKHDRTWLQVEF